MANVDKTVTNVQLIRETGVVVTAVALTSDVSANDTETLIITPTVPGNQMVLIINEISGGGAMTATCAAGDYWAGKAMSTVTIASGTSKAIIFDTAMHKDKDDNTFEVVIAPVAGGKLVTTHAATWQIMQFPPASLLTGV